MKTATWSVHPSAGRGVAVEGSETGAHIALAAGSQTGFDVDFALADPAIANALNSLRAGEPLATSLERLSSWIGMRFPHDGSDPVSERRLPALDAMIAQAEGSRVQLAWVGSGAAYLVRSGHVVRQTIPHTLGHQDPRAKMLGSHLQGVPTRLITRDQAHVELEAWRLESNDRLVFLSGALLRRTGWSDALPAAVIAHADDAEAIGRLAHRAHPNAWGAFVGAVAVHRVA